MEQSTKPIHWIIRTDQPFRGSSQSFTYLDDNLVERVAYTGLTLDEYAKERDYPFRLIPDSEFDALLADFEKSLITEPCEITKEKYWYALEVLPPRRYRNGAFCMSEHNYGNITAWYFQKGERYFTFNHSAGLPEDELQQIIGRA